MGQKIPKGLITVAGEPLVKRSVRLLQEAGIARVTVVTGHLEDRYRKVFDKTNSVSLVWNSLFASSGSLESLHLAFLNSKPSGPVLVLDSDIIFEPSGLGAIIETDDSSVLASGKTESGDEVWIISEGWRINEISKKPSRLGPEVSEFVGITRLQPEFQKQMLDFCSANPRYAEMDYEEALNHLCKSWDLNVCFQKNLAWSEIDNHQQLKRARRMFGTAE
jgi:choline kinase